MPKKVGSFEVGDVVQVKSGGPRMTVAGEGTNQGWVYCIWFNRDDQSGEKKGDQFDPETLDKA